MILSNERTYRPTTAMIVLLNPRAPRRSVPITGSKEGYGHADTGLPGSRLRTQPPGPPPWVGTLYGPAEVTGNQMVAAMDAVAAPISGHMG
jgi:hypothetical protein